MGMIPKELFVAARPPREIILKPEGEIFNALPAFIVPADNVNFVSRARTWMRHYDVRSHTHLEGTSAKISNSPVSGIRIVGLSRRGGGGRAYKAIYPPNYLVDLRESVLLDAIYNMGIEKGGKLGGEFVWSINNSQMRLIRVDSPEYKEFLSFEDLRSLKRISLKDLKAGSIYRGQTGPPQLFLGSVSTIFIHPVWSYNYGNPNRAFLRTLSGVNSYKKKVMLWYKIHGAKSKIENVVGSFTGYINGTFNDNNRDKYYGKPTIETSHNMKKEIGSVELPADVIYLIRDLHRNIIMQGVASLDQGVASLDIIGEKDSFLCSNSPLLNMVPYGEDPVEHMMIDFERILNI